jgi:3,4-dihydroxy-2-butanone 4-phosphate synthase
MSIRKAVEDLKQGKFVIVTDKSTREDEADLILAAEYVTTEKIAFMINHCSGIICVPITKQKAEELLLPPMLPVNTSKFDTPFTIPVDAISIADGGVSAFDRTLTITTILNGRAEELNRPGHVYPLIAHKNGVLEREGHTEATMDILHFAELQPVGVLCELMNPDGTMMRSQRLLDFALDYEITIVSMQEVIDYKKQMRVECQTS